MLNLLTDPWLPVVRLHSGRCTISPAEITAALDSDPVIAIDWPRADFRVATLEFLIGLLCTACPPEDHDSWLEGWAEPPTPEALAAAFAPIAHAFVLDGPGPRFLQDVEDLVSRAEPVERLLIESPGDSTITKNTDLLVRRDRVATLGRAAAAITLYTFQSWAPAGGAGNRTGLRGGGPMVTLVAPTRHATLWHLLWANVPCGERPAPDDWLRVFPWLAPTVTSKDKTVVTPDSAHPLQCWWGMPRRIRLDFTEGVPRPCGLTGVPDDVMVASWRQRPHGPNYAAWGGVHPLTPVYQLQTGTEVLPLHPQPGGVGYRNWLGLVVEAEGGLRRPAASVTIWRQRRDKDAEEKAGAGTRLLAAGYDMDNMKARGFVEAEMPLPPAGDDKARARIDALAYRLVRATDQAARLLRAAVRAALFGAGATVKIEAAMLSAVAERLWWETEEPFFDALHHAATTPEGEAEKTWQRRLLNGAMALFDEVAPLDPDVPPMPGTGEREPRLFQARRRLRSALRGYDKDGEALFGALGLPPPPQPKKQPKPKTPKGKGA